MENYPYIKRKDFLRDNPALFTDEKGRPQNANEPV
jgi:hypothetical protein